MLFLNIIRTIYVKFSLLLKCYPKRLKLSWRSCTSNRFHPIGCFFFQKILETFKKYIRFAMVVVKKKNFKKCIKHKANSFMLNCIIHLPLRYKSEFRVSVFVVLWYLWQCFKCDFWKMELCFCWCRMIMQRCLVLDASYFDPSTSYAK